MGIPEIHLGQNMLPALAIEIIVVFFAISIIFGLKTESGIRRCLKGLAEVVRFFVTKYEALGSRGDLVEPQRSCK